MGAFRIFGPNKARIDASGTAGAVLLPERGGKQIASVEQQGSSKAPCF